MTDPAAKLPTGWSFTKVEDIAAPEARSIAIGPFGSRMKADLYVPKGVPVVRGNNITGSRAPRGQFVYVTEDTANSMPGCLLHSGDLVFPHRGAIGEVGLIESGEVLTWMLSTSLMKLTPDRSRVDSAFLYYYFASELGRRELLMRASTVGTPGIGQPLTSLRSIPIPLPPLEEQRGIAATLGSLDDRLESNRKIRKWLRMLGSAQLRAALYGQANEMSLRSMTKSIVRGVTPKYADNDLESPLVVNQRCVRDGFVGTTAARRMVAKAVPSEKRVTAGDILVNSTGTGTLGRVGRWHDGDVFADSHLSIVKPDPQIVGPTVLAYALFDREADIEGMATGSTGQTELSPNRLADLRLMLPSPRAMEALEATLSDFEGQIASTFAEDSNLISLRDIVLPELLTGRIRVAEAINPVIGSAR